MTTQNSIPDAGLGAIIAWFQEQGWNPFPFQLECWERCRSGYSGLLNAPTGSGKTYALLLPLLMEEIVRKEQGKLSKNPGLKAIWITPIRALSREILQAGTRAISGLGLDWKIGVRTGDTKTAERRKMMQSPPDILVTTPESLHLILATRGYPRFFQSLETLIVDEWHEILGTKRGVQMELALSRLRGLRPKLKTWGISATIGNLKEAKDVLLGPRFSGNAVLVQATNHKRIEVQSIIPEELDLLPWAGHLGIRLLPRIIPIILQSSSTLLFTNTRAQCEIWYQQLLEYAPDLAGRMAMHHGSLSREIRDWVEDGLHQGILKVVVSTSSLDLGVDFRPVETVIQIGSPKGVGRFMQRAGRSGHQPGATSNIYFVPTNALELLESAGIRKAIEEKAIEARAPLFRSFDVLVQYLLTLAVSEGFNEKELFEEVRQTFSFESLTRTEWQWLLEHVTTGGSLNAYEDFHRVVKEDHLYKVTSRRIAMRHRLSIGAIVGDVNLQVKYVSGKFLGNVEEWFIGQLKPGSVFQFAGRTLELVRVKEMTAQVRKSKGKKGKVPSWMGGRLPLSAQLSAVLRLKVEELASPKPTDPELIALQPIADLQRRRSHLPRQQELLVEYIHSREGYHLLIYPFEGRYVHEGISALLAWRLSRHKPITFSMAVNDYGLELLSDSEIPLDSVLSGACFSSTNLYEDIQRSLNEVQMARRQFRDIAAISGLVFRGFPGKKKKDRHLQASSSLFFDVYQDYEPENLLYLQAFEEVRQFQLEESRLRQALERIQQQTVILTRPDTFTPFSFPIVVDRLRETLSSEKLEDRIKKMTVSLPSSKR